MSGFLAGKVWQSALHPDLKPLAAALADIGNDDGTSIYPSVAYMAWLLGRSTRAVQDTLSKLRDQEILLVVSGGEGGRGKTTEYRLMESKLPNRPPWKSTKLLRGLAENHEVDDIKPRSLRQQTTKPTSPEPLVTVSEPSVKEEHLKIFRTTFYREVGKLPPKENGLVQKFKSAVSRHGWVEFERRMRAWLAASAEDYKYKHTERFAASNFLDDVDDFEPEEEEPYPEL